MLAKSAKNGCVIRKKEPTMARNDIKRLNPSGVRLRRTFEQRALKRMISQLDEPDASTESLCRMLHVYCELIRQDAATEKTRPVRSIRPHSFDARATCHPHVIPAHTGPARP